MILSEALAQRLESIAQREGRTPENLLQLLLDVYEAQAAEDNDIEGFIGTFDDDVTDLSVTVRQTLRQRFKEDHDRPS